MQFARHGYHHGNLKEALIAAARKLIAEHGPQGFTLNEASRTAGVSPSAPYRHFRDRNALIEATAEEGFNLFRERLLASAEGAASPYDALVRMGAAYYAFALDEPGFYQAMFSSGLPAVGAPVTEAGDRAFAVLENAVRALGAQEHQVRSLAIKIWAFTHGMTGLIASGSVSPMEAGRLAGDAVDALLRASGIEIPARAEI
ncbi:TetR/AcrR family transcriptional regulator [Taklimakanibacter lacteus]|uniref:TetR/AcrR family transcriptional regulator n=1 Tax=Taklimakanibacter lacteus TaxID=2268456 RepID=UPI0013C4CE84